MIDLIQEALQSNDPKVLSLALKLAQNPLYQFRPRPDRPERLDQQTSFFEDRFPGLACCLAGNGAGKSYVGAAKVASFLLNMPPPERNTPFWVASTTIDLSTSNCWGQNLSIFIPKDAIHDVVWYSATRQLPKAVILKPWKSGHNYVLEFKSYDQSRERLQAANIVGFWLDEQCPFDVLMEVWARTRKWDYPGSKLYTLTPVEPDQRLEQLYQEPPESWRFYRMNTRCNNTLDPSFVRQLEENEIKELVETRLTGAFALYEGAVYKSFSTRMHVVKPFEMPRSWLHVRGLDLGWDHPTACVWAARDLEGRYHVYREYLKSQTSVEDHVREINEGWDKAEVRGHTYADPAAAQTLHEFSMRGLDTAPANKDVLAGIATVQSLLRPDEQGKPKLYVCDNCPNLIGQIRSYVWDGKEQDKPKKENDDLADALRYLCHSHKLDQEMNWKPPVITKRPQPQPRLISHPARIDTTMSQYHGHITLGPGEHTYLVPLPTQPKDLELKAICDPVYHCGGLVDGTVTDLYVQIVHEGFWIHATVSGLVAKIEWCYEL